MAKLLFTHKVASREHIMKAMTMVTPNQNVGQVLVEHGVISKDIYNKLIAFMKKKVAEQNPAQPSAPAAQSPSTSQKAPDPTPAPLPESSGDQVTTIPVEERELESYPPIEKRKVKSSEEATLPEDFTPHTGMGQLKVAIPAELKGNYRLDEVFCLARKHNASDIHICPGTPIIFRRFGALVTIGDRPLQQKEIETLVCDAFGDELTESFLGEGDLEFVYTIEGGGRFRVTLMRENFGFDLTARVIPMSIMSFEESGLPEVCKGLTKWAQGMVLVTGPIGSGKSSTLAVLVDLINQDRDDHIISIESPIEMVYEPKRCQITQRELNQHTLSQNNALRAALRQDPDIIVISELRDLESIQLAVSAAETGHLVLATMNTASATRTIYRLIDSFPPEEQGIIRNMVSLSLRGIISQQLIPKIDGSGVIPAFEVLVVNTAISNLIRKNNSHLIESAMITGKQAGMVLLDDSLDTLFKQGIISGKEAFYRCINPKRFTAVKDK